MTPHRNTVAGGKCVTATDDIRNADTERNPAHGVWDSGTTRSIAPPRRDTVEEGMSGSILAATVGASMVVRGRVELGSRAHVPCGNCGEDDRRLPSTTTGCDGCHRDNRQYCAAHTDAKM